MASDVRASAFCLIFLLGGGECFRVNQLIVADPAEETEANLKDWWPGWWGAGDAACRTDTETRTWSEWWNDRNVTLDGPQTLDRYQHKMIQLQILVSSIKRQNCTSDCFASWKQVQERLRQLESCTDLMRPDAFGAPVEFTSQELRETAAVKFSELGRDAIHVMKAHGYLKPTDKCGFYFDNLNFEKAMQCNETHADSEFRKKMFGERCDAEAKAIWLNNMDSSQAEFVRTLEQEFDKQSDALQKGALPADVELETKVKHIIESGFSDPKGGMNSLIQVEQGADVAFALEAIFAAILSVLFGIIIFCIIMFVLYMVVVVAMFSAVGEATRGISTRPRGLDDDLPPRLGESGLVVSADTDRGMQQPVNENSGSDTDSGTRADDEPISSNSGGGGQQYTQPSTDSPLPSAAFSCGHFALGCCVAFGQIVLM